MHGNIGLHEQYALVSPQAFSEQMDHHWTHGLSVPLCSSQPLRTLWKVMGTTFQTAIVETAKGIVSPWRVLQPPTGSGKTQGACVYSAMQADLNQHTGEHRKPVGILIVTRRIEQANEIAATINTLVGRVVAVAHHSQNRATPDQLQVSDILVITHQAYVNASHSLKGQREASWGRLLSWRGGNRLLTIIDEALANAIEGSKVTATSLAQVIAYVPPNVRQEHPQQVAVLEQLHKVLVTLVETQEDEDNTACMVWHEHNAPSSTDMAPLRAAMWNLPYDRMVLNKDSAQDRQRIAKLTDDVLRDAETIVDQFAYYAQKGNEHSINSAALLVPQGIPGPVVLDATARANFLWDLFEDRAAIIPVPNRVRDYSNVVLHVARAAGLGKHSMVKNINQRCPRVLTALEAEIGPERSVFMCMHQATEHVALSYTTHFKQFAVGHWNAVDGRNDWAEFDTALIFGMPYRDQIWANNTFFALQGAQDDEWLSKPAWKDHRDVRKVMEQRQLSVSIIQAINRICCRRVVDAFGRSPLADIFIVLPNDKTGDAILQDIQADMPGLVIVDWSFELDGAKVRRPRKGTSHTALLSLMSNKLPGEPVAEIWTGR
jgi:hypothetical protein